MNPLIGVAYGPEDVRFFIVHDVRGFLRWLQQERLCRVVFIG